MPPTDLPPAGAASRGPTPAILDTLDALERVMGNRQLYARMLTRFRTEYQDFPATLQGALATGDTEHAQRLAHTLKGAAGMIGALALHIQAAALERAIDRGEDEWQREFDKLKLELDMAIAALGAQLEGTFG